MNIKDYEDEFLDDESYGGNSGPRKFRVPKEEGHHRNRHKGKQVIRKQRQEKERLRQESDWNDWDDE